MTISSRWGNIEFQAVHTPGHTPEHLSYLVRDAGGGAKDFIALASGDFVFVGDVGRPDLLERAAGIAGVMEPSARAQFASIQREFQQLAGVPPSLAGTRRRQCLWQIAGRCSDVDCGLRTAHEPLASGGT